ncbi:PTS glucose/sucrose transporter subunit IIB [bacterium]|nr:PTS glucose/sucrose transporter subunit IIB [bacterium]
MERAEELLIALGGKENIEKMDACITRLRLEVKDAGKVNEARLRQLGALGVVKMGKAVQVIFGTTAEAIEAELRKLWQG